MNDRSDTQRQGTVRRRGWIAAGAAVLGFGLLGSLGLILWASGEGAATRPAASAAGNTPPLPPDKMLDGLPPILNSWVAASDEGWTAQNAAGTFHVVNIIARAPQEMLLFYAMQTAQQGTPQITVIARPIGSPTPGQAPADVPLAVTAVQPLGSLAEFDAGLVRVAWPTQSGHFILLVNAAPSGASGTPWHLAPIQDFQVIINSRSYVTGAAAPPALGQVSVACPCGGDGFRLAILGRSLQAVPPLYITIDPSGEIALLSADAWNALWPTPPPFNGVAEPTFDLEHPHFAPTYPPTPTFDPTAPTWTPNLPPPPPTAGSQP